ncbi:uncharacterized protein J4E78_006077 [Alternaria triticimaculans]|uniref:uncharacterized protein n=1 Tax=Alternaria triticimaculans TaxID=297637 RepID=UPI0020C4CB78|nr:uncharacterized protein J4E78_006077 [Alternaria triticimaculans]KAI4657689.1 hypothetical protein J4E78_006077 [Alternaria triticimaculans]
MTDSNTEELLSAPRCVPFHDTSDSLQRDGTRILKSFKNDFLSITFLSNDGVLRSLTADRKVLSAEGPRPDLIEAFLSRFPKYFRAQITSPVFADSAKTPKEKWFEPDAGVLPEPLSQQEIEKFKNQPEERTELLRKRMREDETLLDVNGVLV